MDQSSKIRYWKRVADATADDMQRFCAVTEPDVPVFGRFYRQSTGALARAASMVREFGREPKEEIEPLLVQLKSLGARLDQGRPHIQAFRDTVKATPRVTTAYIAAQNRTVAVLSSLDSEYGGVQQHTVELVNGLEDLIREAH